MLKNLVSPKLPSNTKRTGGIFNIGGAAMTALLNPFANAPEGLTTISISILQMKLSSFSTCAGGTLMQGWLCSGKNSCSTAIPASFPAFTVSLKKGPYGGPSCQSQVYS